MDTLFVCVHHGGAPRWGVGRDAELAIRRNPAVRQDPRTCVLYRLRSARVIDIVAHRITKTTTTVWIGLWGEIEAPHCEIDCTTVTEYDEAIDSGREIKWYRWRNSQ